MCEIGMIGENFRFVIDLVACACVRACIRGSCIRVELYAEVLVKVLLQILRSLLSPVSIIHGKERQRGHMMEMLGVYDI